MGISIGAIAAPPVATWFALRYDWRWAFIATGLLGFIWIPLWLWTSRRVPARVEREAADISGSTGDLLRDRRLWAFAAANALGMLAYTLWSNWTTVFLEEHHGLALRDTAWLAAVPPMMASAGGLAGGWASSRWIRSGTDPLTARLRACTTGAVATLVTLLVPAMPAPALSIAAISASFFFAVFFSVNIYSMPLDAFGAARAAFSISMLTGSYGLMQTFFSPAIGFMVDRWGFRPVCIVTGVAPLVGVAVLWRFGRAESGVERKPD
jgi:ACS family hexuronate transporter-like MFS transporter